MPSRHKHIPVGARFFRWLVLNGPVTPKPFMYACLCDCGTARNVRARELREGNSKSCGCYHREAVAERFLKHGAARTVEYRAWSHMKERCENPRAQEYGNYGARGVKVCDAWRESFAAFLRDVGERPDSRLSLDRIDNGGDYEPGNVRWATKGEQSLNRRPVKRYEHAGQLLTVHQWADTTGLPYETLRQRIVRMRWDVRRALTTPISQKHRRHFKNRAHLG